MDKELVRLLIRLLGEKRVFTERADLISYCLDYSSWPSYEESVSLPLAVVLPETTEEVAEIVKLAVKHRTPIVPRGGGSSQVGGVIPIEGSIVLSTARMNKIIEIDPTNLMVTAQPGVNLKEMDDLLSPQGLILGQEQGSYKVACLGGAVSTNGYSMRHNRYRNIGDNVLSLEVVLGDGRILRTGRKVASNSSGYPLHKIFVGAEGTLGIITELTLRVAPKPEKEVAMGALFDSWESVEKTCLRIMQSGVGYTGGYGARSRYEGFDEIVNIIFVTLEGTAGEVDAQEMKIDEIFKRNGGKRIDREMADDIRNSHIMMWCGDPHPELSIEDLVAVMPLQYYDEAFARMEREVFPKYGFATDDESNRVIGLGTRPLACFNFLYDPKKLPLPKLQEAFGEMMRIVAEYGGAGPGCHAVGMLLRDCMEIEHDPVRLGVMREMKSLFDPHNIMNPGKKIRI